MLSKITTLAGHNTTFSTASLLMGAGELVPYLIGGIALYLYLEAHKEVERSFKSFFAIVAGAVVVGLGSKGIVSFGGSLIEHWAINQFSYIDDVVEKVKTLVESVTYIISFGLASLSRTMYNRFFANRDKVLDLALTANPLKTKEKEH